MIGGTSKRRRREVDPWKQVKKIGGVFSLMAYKYFFLPQEKKKVSRIPICLKII